MNEYYICKLCGSKIHKYDLHALLGHIKAIQIELNLYSFYIWDLRVMIRNEWFIQPDKTKGWVVKTVRLGS